MHISILILGECVQGLHKIEKSNVPKKILICYSQENIDNFCLWNSTHA